MWQQRNVAMLVAVMPCLQSGTVVDVHVTPAGGTQLLQRALTRPPADAEIASALAQVQLGKTHAGETPMEAPPSGGPFSDFFNRHSEGHGINKWLHYFPAYQRHLARFIGQEVHIMEVGVQSGGSLDMWKTVFGERAHVYGCDINPNITLVSGNATQTFVGDQSDPAFWANVRSAVPQVDIFIDDGGHTLEMQLVTLGEMLPHLSPNGVYITEDVHGEDNAFWQTWALQREFASPAGKAYPGLAEAVGSVHVYPFLMAVERAPASETAMQLHLGEQPSEVRLHLPSTATPEAASQLESMAHRIAPGIAVGSAIPSPDIATGDVNGGSLLSSAVTTEFPQLPPHAWLLVACADKPFEFGDRWGEGSETLLKTVLSNTSMLHAPSMARLVEWQTQEGGVVNEMQRSLDSMHMYPGLFIMQRSDGLREEFHPRPHGTEWISR